VDGAPSGSRIAGTGPEVLHDDRPWGWFRRYADNTPCTVKVIAVHPGEELSLQRHAHRDELWVALDDGLVVTIDDQVTVAEQGQEFWVPRGAVHRAGATDRPARFLEVAFGDFHEDDIERLEDRYGRG
jgi:mannose-6-phosphate isomerase